LLLLALSLAPPGVAAGAGDVPRPLGPEDDARVLARVPRLSPEERARARALREGAAPAPLPLPQALRQARAHISRFRQESDPRHLGYAQAALGPWWEVAAPPADVLLLRAIIRQGRHDFTGALGDLDQVLARRPDYAQAWLTRASLQLVRGEPAAARASCEPLGTLAPGAVAEVCLAGAEGLSGKAAQALARLDAALALPAARDVSVRQWALALQAELAHATGDAARADRALQQALAAGPADGFLLGARADFLLEAGRPREVLALLAEHAHADGLLLRLARAAAVAGDAEAAGRHREALRARLEAGRARGDRIHLREEALFALHVEGRPAEALPLAQENWAEQRERVDARVLLEAALAAKEPAAAQPVLAWMDATGLEDVQLRALAARLRGAASQGEQGKEAAR
jgi:hypothetical protein